MVAIKDRGQLLWEAFHTSSQMTARFYRMYRPEATMYEPEDIVPMLNKEPTDESKTMEPPLSVAVLFCKAVAEDKLSVPALTVVAPVKVFDPDSVNVPASALVRPPLLEMTLEIVVLPAPPTVNAPPALMPPVPMVRSCPLPVVKSTRPPPELIVRPRVKVAELPV